MDKQSKIYIRRTEEGVRIIRQFGFGQVE